MSRICRYGRVYDSCSETEMIFLQKLGNLNNAMVNYIIAFRIKNGNVKNLLKMN